MEREQSIKFLHDMLRALGTLKATELLFATGRPMSMMMKGHDKHTALSEKILEREVIRDLARLIMPREQALQFDATSACEFAYSPAGIGNFQASAAEHEGNMTLLLRVVTVAPTTDSRGMLAG